MDDFLCEVQCDELYVPTSEDWAEYEAYLAEQEAKCNWPMELVDFSEKYSVGS